MRMSKSMILYRPTRMSKPSDHEFTELKSLVEFPFIYLSNFAMLRCRYYTDEDKAEFDRIKELAERDGCLRMILIDDQFVGPNNAIAVTANIISEPHICYDGVVPCPYFVIPCRLDTDWFEFVNYGLYVNGAEHKM